MPKLLPGDKVACGRWVVGTVVDLYPKGMILVNGQNEHGQLYTEFMLDSSNPDFLKVEVGPGYRILEDNEAIKTGD